MTSPDKRIEVKRVDTGFEVFHEGKQVLSMTGKPTPAPPEGRGPMLRLGEGSGPRHLHVSYDMVSGKRSHCENEANEYRYRIGGGKELVFRVFNDGVAFRYEGGSEELLSYRIPEGTQPGTEFRIKGSGIQQLRGSGKGDLVLRVKVEVPRRLNNKQKDLLRQFDETTSDREYDNRKSFMDRVKELFS